MSFGGGRQGVARGCGGSKEKILSMSLSKVQKAVATIPSGPGMWLKKTCCKVFFFVEKKEQKRERGLGGQMESHSLPRCRWGKGEVALPTF